MFAPFLLVNLLHSIHLGATATLNRATKLNYTWENPHTSPRLNLLDSARDPLTVKLSNTSLSHQHRVTCDPEQFGTHLNSRSCLDAIGEIRRGNAQLRVGQRGFGSFKIQLPFRWISGQSITPSCQSSYGDLSGSRRSLCRRHACVWHSHRGVRDHDGNIYGCI